jgi:UDP-N-acetylglucosamine 2-epimerase (non-hydrolysing)
MTKRILTIFGTRPEAIKMAPVVKALAASPRLESIVCSTGQHREMLKPILSLFDVAPDYDLDLLRPGQSLNALFASALQATSALIEQVRPDRVLVHGDTTTAGAAALAAFHLGVPVGHVEAGLRTRDLKAPWPEEMNRRLVDVVADLLFAPTAQARARLEEEALGRKRVLVTGNTVIDALLEVDRRLSADPALAARLDAAFPWIEPEHDLVLVTGHRRENFGAAFEQVALALRDLARDPNVRILYPVHLNPNAREPARRILSGVDGVFLVEPVDYLAFVRLMRRAALIVSDSGGVQEEAPSLGKRVLVTREVTERPEAVEAGVVELVGSDRARIVAAARRCLSDPSLRDPARPIVNPYGDGAAAARIVEELERE